MIHITTIHYGSPRWIDVQLDFLARYTGGEYRTYAWLDGVSPDYGERFDHVEQGEAPVAAKHDGLGAAACAAGDDDDLLVFLHGDSLPIDDWVERCRAALEEVPLVAVRRDENLGEPHPHPCFTVTTTGFWQEIEGTWAAGPKWVGPGGRPTTDIGAELWQILERRGIEWKPLLRSNVRNLHPMWFGIYGDIVYHHGAGFRRPISRLDSERTANWPRPLARLERYRLARMAELRSLRLFRRLEAGDEFFRELMRESAGG